MSPHLRSQARGRNVGRAALGQIRRHNGLPTFTHAMTLDATFFGKYIPASPSIPGDEVSILSNGIREIQPTGKQYCQKNGLFYPLGFHWTNLHSPEPFGKARNRKKSERVFTPIIKTFNRILTLLM